MPFERAGLAVVLSVSIVVRAAAAQEPQERKEESPKKVIEVVVTASRLEEPARDVGSSVTVVPGTDLARNQHRMVLDALREVPSLDVVQTGARGGLTSVFLRGADPGHTLVLIDGVEANDPVSADRSYDFAHLSTDNVERIEVLRGPQSVLYGSDAMGGVVNVITRRGRGDPKASLMAEGGSFATYRAGVSLAGGTDRVNYSVGASHSQTRGISAADKQLGNSEKDGDRNDSFSTRIGLNPAEFVEVDVAVRAMEGRSEIDNGGGIGGDDPNRVFESAQWLLRAAPRLKLLDGLWDQIMAVSLLSARFNDNNPTDPASAGAYSFSAFESRRVGLDWQHTLALHETQKLILGAEFEEEEGESASDFSGFTVDFPRETAWTRSAYAQHRVHVWDRLTATAGVRVDDHEEFGAHTTYRATGAWLVPETSSKVRATVGTGFKAPSLFQLFSSFGDPNLDPERSLGWDAGIDQGFLDDRLTASLTYFRNDFERLIEFDGAQSRYVNVGRAKTSGVEAALRFAVIKDLDLRLSYSLADTEDKATDEELIRRARHKGSVRAIYAVTKEIDVSASALYIGRRDDLDFSTFPATRVRLDDHVLLNLAASWRVDDRCEFFARGENLSDKKYEEVFGFGTPGVAVYIGASVSF